MKIFGRREKSSGGGKIFGRQEKIFDGRINGAKESGTHRVQIFKIAEQNNLPVAAEILSEVRAGLGEFDLDFLARQKETAGDGKYYPLP